MGRFASKFILGRIQFLVVPGPRSPFPGWLWPGGGTLSS